jgi:catechol 2,3-dioxygenase-like lactoylglutathione lyase family enzyme
VAAGASASNLNAVRVSLDHANIFASDPAATVEFFRTMFGATVVWDEVVAGARVVRLQLGRAFVEVYDQPPRAPRGGAFHHLGIETDDLGALVRQMTSRGFVFRNPMREEKTFKYVMIAGPDDLLIELFECHEPDRWRIRVDGQDAGLANPSVGAATVQNRAC